MISIVDDYSASFRDLSNDKALQLMESDLAAEAERLQVRRSVRQDPAGENGCALLPDREQDGRRASLRPGPDDPSRRREAQLPGEVRG